MKSWAKNWCALTLCGGLLAAAGATPALANDPETEAMAAGQSAAPEPIEALRARAKAGDAPAQLELGRRYAQGRDGVEKNPQEALRWVRQAAESGLPDAQVALGQMYERGVGVMLNVDRAVELYPCS